MKAVAVPTTSGVARGRDCYAFIGGNADAGELANDPAVGELIVKHHRISGSCRLARSTEARPNTLNTHRPEYRSARSFVEDLKSFVNHLHVLRRSHLAVGIRRRAVAANTWERDTVKVENRAWH